MAEKITINADQVISNVGGTCKYADSDGHLKQAPSDQMEIRPLPPKAAKPVEVVPPQELKAKESLRPKPVAVKPKPVPKVTEVKAQHQPKQPAQPQAKTGVKTMAAKKKVAKKGNGVRTIGGKEVDLSKYKKVKAPGGGVSYNNGDTVAQKLAGKTLDEVYSITAKGVKIDEKTLRSKFKHLNPGMQRMNLGNMLRKGPREEKAAKSA